MFGHLLFGDRSARRAAVRGPWSGKHGRQLVMILLGVGELHQLATRHELLLLMGEQLELGRAFAVPENPDPAAHLRAIVRAARRGAALEALRDALEEMAPDDIDAAWFKLAATVLTRPDGPLPAGFMMELIGELRNHPPDFARAAVSRYRAERRAAGHPLDGRTLPQVLFRLYDARMSATDPDAPRRHLRAFLRQLTTEPGRSNRLATLLARLPGCEPGGRPQAAAAAVAVRAERQVIIQIRVEEEDAPSDLPYTRRRYSLRGLHYEGTADARLDFHCSWDWPGLFTGDELERCGHEFLAAWHAQEAVDWGPGKRVEFLLPDSLLGYAAEMWPGGSSGVPLSRSCQVVVRSLRRYKDSSLHPEWDRRWQVLDRDCVPGDALHRIGWMSPDRGEPENGDGADFGRRARFCPDSKYPPLRLTDPADVEDWLRHNADLACLGLGTPYDHHDPLIRDAVLDALLEDGIPVMVWRRDAGDPAHLLDALRDVSPPALLAELPRSVLEARKRGRRDETSLGKQITLLWDDPTCVFRTQDSRMSGTRGAGEGAA
ncbi:hypothetical protein [Streptomyces sp. NPDC046197]|uniref:VMAP-C domain-containing protein n=1 Tax=Streptomyces sp. NPDC046197 TaxID=3154337 RepID=UPI0033FAEFF6